MNYYEYDTDTNNFNSVHLILDEGRKILNAFHKAKPMAKKWTPITVHAFDDNPGPDGDFPSLNDYSLIPIFSERAWAILKPLIGTSVEALPIIYPSGKPFYMINIIGAVDCLDESRSEVTRNDFSNRISRIWRYAFISKPMNGKHILQLPTESGSDVLVSESFRSLYEHRNLQGLLFKPLPLVE